MPFNSGGQTYQGGNYLFQGLSGLGEGISKAIENAQNQSKMESYNDSIVQHAYQAGQVDLDQLTKYRQMGHTQKTGFAASLAANFAEDLKREQLAAARESRQGLAEQRSAEAQLRQQQAAAFNWTPDEAAKQAARWAGNELVQTGPGKFTPVAYGGGGQDEVQTDPLKVAGNVIPGIGVNRKTGQYVYFPQDVGGGVKIEVEPRTGVPFYRDLKGNPKPLTGQQIMGGQMLPPAATPTPTPDQGQNWLQKALISAGIGSAPAPSVTPAAVGASGNDVTGAPPAAMGAPVQTAQGVGSQATPTEQEAIAYLQAHKLPVTEANIKHYIENASKSK